MNRPRTVDGGFGLVEVIVAMTVFLVITGVTSAILIRAMQTVDENADRVFAAGLARSELERIRSVGPEQYMTWRTSGQNSGTYEVTGPNGVYTVTSDVGWERYTQNLSSCDAKVDDYGVLRARVSVIGGRLESSQFVDTLIAPADDAVLGKTGNIKVVVTNRAGAKVAGVSVWADNPSFPGLRLEGVTTADGCVLLPDGSPSASWKVHVRRSGYVPPTPGADTQAVSITASSTTTVDFLLDQAATVILQAPPMNLPLAGGVKASWINANVRTLVDLPSTQTDLWPDPVNYGAYLGSCPVTGSVITGGAVVSGAAPNVWSIPGGQIQIGALDAIGDASPVVAVTTARVPDPQCSQASTIDLISGGTGIVNGTVPFGTWSFSTSPDVGTLTCSLVTTAVVSFSWPVDKEQILSANPDGLPTECTFAPPPAVPESLFPVPVDAPSPSPTATAGP